MSRVHLISACVAILVVLSAGLVRAEDAYYRLTVSSLTITEGKRPEPASQPADRPWRVRQLLRPYAVIDGGGEAYFNANDMRFPRERTDDLLLACAPAGKEVTGRLFLVNGDESGLTMLKFKAPDAKPLAEAKKDFLEAKARHYRWLLEQDMPGAAWFRHQQRMLAEEAGTPLQNTDLDLRRFRDNDEVDRTYGLFSADRAVSENLQLDRALRPSTAPAETTVDIVSIAGITVKEFDWKPLIKDAKPQLDPLASLIPADQHAIFFPTFDAMITLADEADRQGTPLLQLAEPQSQDAGVKERYQKQLCLSMTSLGRLLGPRVINSVAFTGSDPYLRQGSDVAVLFEAKDIATMKQLLAAQMALAQQMQPDAKSVEGDVDGVAYTGLVSPDRSICSYRAVLGETVVVTNSLPQLKRIVAVQKKTDPALASQDEYIFFRDRYKRGDGDETALIILSDATIRRWCSAKWRIADSRRARAAAVLAEFQAQRSDPAVVADKPGGEITSPWFVPELGKVTGGRDITSSTYGTLAFMTPIVELPIDKVTTSEREAYVRWRDSYQQNWTGSFDPIAARIAIGRQKLSADVTVMPLIARTDYSQVLEVIRGARIAPNSGDPHGALLHWAMAVNRESKPMREWGNILGLKVDPLSWVGQTVALWVDDDPFWDELLQQPDPKHWIEKQFHRLPVAVYAEVRNPLKLALVLTAVRVLMDQAAPGMATWETLSYRDQAYVKVSPTEKARHENRDIENLSIFYTPTPNAIMLTLREEMLQDFIDRQIARGVMASTQPSTRPAAKAPTSRPWLGESMCLQVDKRFGDLLAAGAHTEFEGSMQARAWSNIPILNEWHRLFPSEDPVKVHERLWHVRLLCPAGGSYVWNDQWQTMESTLFGHPGQPKSPKLPPPWAGFKLADFGVTFEHDGLRAKTVLEKE